MVLRTTEQMSVAISIHASLRALIYIPSQMKDPECNPVLPNKKCCSTPMPHKDD